MPDIKVQLEKLEEDFKGYEGTYAAESETLTQAIQELQEAVAEHNQALAGSYNSEEERQAFIQAKNRARLEKEKKLDGIPLNRINIMIINYKVRKNRLEKLREMEKWNSRRERIERFTTALQLINARVATKTETKWLGTSDYIGNNVKDRGHLYLEEENTIVRGADNKVDLNASKIDGKQNLRALLTKLKEEEGCEINLELTNIDKEGRDRVIQNLNMKLETINVHNAMSLETIQMLMAEGIENFQFAKAIMKSLHEANVQSARGMAGR